MNDTPDFTPAEIAYDLIMSEARRRDVGTLADILAAIHVDGAPAYLDRPARLAHALGILDQISTALEQERATLRAELGQSPDLARPELAAVGLAQDAQARLLREHDFHDVGGQWRRPIRKAPLADFEEHMNRLGGRYAGPVTPSGTRSVLGQLLETEEYLQAEAPAAERGEWIARAREALGRPPAA